jgi:hypothetical protein
MYDHDLACLCVRTKTSDVGRDGLGAGRHIRRDILMESIEQSSITVNPLQTRGESFFVYRHK